MNFGEALERVKSGKKIQREGWNGKNQFVELGSHVSYVSPNGEVVNANHEAIGSQVLVFHGTSGVQVGWLASPSDMLAEDWRAFNEENPNTIQTRPRMDGDPRSHPWL